MDKGIRMQKEIAMGVESKREKNIPTKVAKMKCGGAVKTKSVKKGKK